MAQILDSLPSDDPDVILCCYVNVTSKIQVARVTNVADWYFERVVFPGQKLLFEAVSAAKLEIHTGMMASSILSDTIPCTRLRIGPNGEQIGSYNASSTDSECDSTTIPARSTEQSALSSIS